MQHKAAQAHTIKLISLRKIKNLKDIINTKFERLKNRLIILIFTMSGEIESKTEPDEFRNSQDLEAISEKSTEMDEVKNAIDDIVKDSETIENFTEFHDYDFESNENLETSYSNVLKYWQRDEPIELSTNYAKYEANEDPSFKKDIIKQENKTYNSAMKINFNARIKHEYGVSFGQSETIDEHERRIVFQALNPSMWKFMYEASSFLVFSAK